MEVKNFTQYCIGHFVRLLFSNFGRDLALKEAVAIFCLVTSIIETLALRFPSIQ